MFHPHNFRNREPFDGLFYRINDGLDKALYTVHQIESLYRKLERLSPELEKLRSWLSASPQAQMKMSTRSAAHAGRRRSRKRRNRVRIG